jgi:hypothetical protein
MKPQKPQVDVKQVYASGRGMSVTVRDGRLDKVTTWVPGAGTATTLRVNGDLKPR